MRSFFKRLLTAKGHGVHSPFAFSFINKVIYEKLPYYAFADIKKYLIDSDAPFENNNSFNELSFRLVNFYLPSDVLEIGSGNGINTLYLTSPSVDIKCTCIEKDVMKKEMAQSLLQTRQNYVHFAEEIPKKKFDAIVMDMNYFNNLETIDTDKLIEYSQDNAFWIINNIHSNKHHSVFWENIKINPMIQNTFELKQCGIVILNSSLSKLNYLL